MPSDLTDQEREILTELAKPGHGVRTPQDVARAMGITWQQVTRTVRPPEKMMLVKARRLPKQTSYEVTPLGEEYLAALSQLHLT